MILSIQNYFETMTEKVILLGINEINFEYVKYYVEKGLLPNFAKLLKNNNLVETTSESEYKLLEPWIQWVTLHTGKTYDEHKVFRLGDITQRKELSQIFEELEAKGKTVGAVSPFNADNRLKSAKFFIPDPWTKTPVSGNSFVRRLSDAVQQSVNDNANSKLDVRSLLSIGIGILRYVKMSRWPGYFKAFLNRANPGIKATILDRLLSDVFLSLWQKNKPDFSLLFLNSGAHIQHHYLFNSEAYKGDFKNPEWYCKPMYDPFIKILEEYDSTIGRLIDMDVKLIIATGLHQKPHKHLTFYWRLKNHVQFLKEIGVTSFKSVLPRMSRDFLIEFDNPTDCSAVKKVLEDFKDSKSGKQIFRCDNRGDSLFVELIFPDDIPADMAINNGAGLEIQQFKNFVSFVAIKNGEHDGVGYILSNFKFITESQIPLKDTKGKLLDLVLN